MNVMKDWHKKYKNEVRVKDNVITLSGSIGGDSWFSEGNISAKKVRELVSDINGDITIRLNSPGGSAFEGIEIYNELKALPNRITVEVTALAASAASLICMAADEILMCTGSMMMIHNAWTYTAGNAEELLKVVDDLEKIDSSIKSIYSEKTGIDIGTISQYMAEEKFWTADETIELGFADSKRDKVEEDSKEQEEETKTGNEELEALIRNIVTETFNNLTKGDSSDEKESGSISMQQNKLKKLFGGK